MNLIIKIFSILLTLALFLSCGNSNVDETIPAPTKQEQIVKPVSKQGQAFVKDDESKPNILQIAIGSKDHSTLIAAVQAAELENALVNAGPLMVFAPINSAFDALPEGTVENLLKPENKAKLAYILKHHVTPGNYSKEFLKKFKKLGQASNENIMVEVKGDDVYVGGAKIIASVKAGNGIIHVVDKVILPTK